MRKWVYSHHIKRGNFFVEGKNVYINIPSICRFDSTCNGKCHDMNLQVNHSGRKYCLVINCTDSSCRQNHPLQWHNIPKHMRIYTSRILPHQYADKVCLNSGIDVVRQIVFDNIDLDSTSPCYELFRAFQHKLECYEVCRFDKEDYFVQELNKKKMIEIFAEKQRQREMRIQEQVELGRSMVHIYINIRNAEALNKQIVKQRFKDKIPIFLLIEKFLGNEHSVIPTFVDL